MVIGYQLLMNALSIKYSFGNQKTLSIESQNMLKDLIDQIDNRNGEISEE